MPSVCLLCMAALSVCMLIIAHPIHDTMQTDVATDARKTQYTEADIRRLILQFGHGMKDIYHFSKGAFLWRKRNAACFLQPGFKGDLFLCLYSNKQPHSPENNHEAKPHLRYIRSDHVDPSDPLGSENPSSRNINYRRQNREPERSGNVSKESIASCDDPLHVLLSKAPVSPHLQKKRNKQVDLSEMF